MNELTTEKRISTAALELFLAQGIRRTSVEEIASRSGVTRVTVYRYFADRSRLVHSAFELILDVFAHIQEQVENNGTPDIAQTIGEIREGLSALPGGDLPSRLDELERVHPDIYRDFHSRRIASVQAIFDTLFASGNRQGILRDDLDESFIRLYFSEVVIDLIENPRFSVPELPPAEFFSQVTTVFLRGILAE